MQLIFPFFWTVPYHYERQTDWYKLAKLRKEHLDRIHLTRSHEIGRDQILARKYDDLPNPYS